MKCDVMCILVKESITLKSKNKKLAFTNKSFVAHEGVAGEC